MNDRRQFTLVCGASATGKTTFALRYLLNGPAAFRFIFDADGDFARLLGCAPAETQSAAIYQLEKSGWCIFDPARMFPTDYQAGLQWFGAWAWATAERLPGPKIFVCDELTRWGVDPWNCPAALLTLAQAGRKRGFELLATTHEPNRLNGALAGQLTELVTFAFPSTAGAARGALEKFGLAPDEIPMAPGHYLAADLTTGGRLAGNLFGS